MARSAPTEFRLFCAKMAVGGSCSASSWRVDASARSTRGVRKPDERLVDGQAGGFESLPVALGPLDRCLHRGWIADEPNASVAMSDEVLDPFSRTLDVVEHNRIGLDQPG